MRSLDSKISILLCLVLASAGSMTAISAPLSRPVTVAAQEKTKRSKLPSAALSASSSAVAAGESITLSWSSTNATACTASQGWSGPRATRGSETVARLDRDTTFALVCTGKKGSASQSVTVTVLPAPTLTLTSDPAAVTAGQASTLTWSSTNATSCTASGAWSGARATSGSESSGALAATTIFTLTCSGAGGSVTQSASVIARKVKVTTGVVYRRDDSIAYTPGFLPENGLANVDLTLLESKAISNPSGAFSLTNVGPPEGTAYSMLRATAAGYATTWVPWLSAEAAAPRPVAMYDDTPATPRPGFTLGMVPHDVGGFMNAVFNAGLFAPTFDRAKNSAGANLVTLVDTIWINRLDTAAGVVEMAGNPPNMSPGMVMSPDRAMYEVLVPQAHARGLQAMIMIGVYPASVAAGRYWTDMGALQPTDTAVWNAWFAAFKPLVVERAKIARDLGVEQFSFFNHWAQAPVQYWRDLVDAIRATGYTGKLSFFGHVDMASGGHAYKTQEYFFGRAQVLSFMQLWDYVGLSVYDGIAKTAPGEVLVQAQRRSRMRASMEQLLQGLSFAPVPLMVMLGTPSVHGGVSNGEYIEPCLLCGSLAPQRQLDLEQQADMYQAVCETIDRTPVGNGRVIGLLSWGYHFRDDFTTLLEPGDSAYDKSASIRGKPAEAVVKHWVARWAN